MKRKKKKKSYLAPNDVAELLMVSPVTVRQWALKGDLHAMTTPGGHRRFSYHEIERFARERGLTLQPTDHSSLRILIVDDDVQLTGFLTELLTGFPQAVETEVAHNGFEAGQKVSIFQPHIMLLDLMMSGMDGFEVCSRLKENPSTKAIRVIAMTGRYNKNNVKKIISVGAEACLSKPLDIGILLNLIGIHSDFLVKTPAS